MFHRIIVGFDGSDGGRDAIALAGSLAADTADIVVVNAFPYSVSPAYGTLANYAELMHDDAHAQVASALPKDPRFRPLAIADWSPGRVLHKVASDEHADLIVVGSARHGPIGRVVLGDVSRSALHGSPCTVAVAPRGLNARPIGPISTIAIGLNGTPQSDAALAVAADIASATGARLRLLTAIAPPAALAPTYTYAYDWAEIEADNRRFAEQQLAATAASLEVPAETKVVIDNAGLMLEEESEHADLIVVGSRRWGTFRSVVLGSTSDRLVHHAKCPVVVVPCTVAVDEREEALHV